MASENYSGKVNRPASDRHNGSSAPSPSSPAVGQEKSDQRVIFSVWNTSFLQSLTLLVA